jgi:hypothetical protein
MSFLNNSRKLLTNPDHTPTLSPAVDPARPECILFPSAFDYITLQSAGALNRSPKRLKKSRLLDKVLEKSSLLKVKSDIVRGFDISTVLYCRSLDQAAWGIIIDRVGRIYDASCGADGLLELSYQSGACGSKRDWRRLVASLEPDVEDETRRFYSKLEIVAGNKIAIAGSVGFGLWDALWMSFDLETAYQYLKEDPDFVAEVFQYWSEFHISSVWGMLNSGVDMIFVRENPLGFPLNKPTSELLDPFVGEIWREITGIVRSQGGMIFLDCDNDEMLETEFPLEWGFTGIGPMVFSNEHDLQTARNILNDELVLIGSTMLSGMPAHYAAGESFPEVLHATRDNHRETDYSHDTGERA